jgi:hypothetical protein
MVLAVREYCPSWGLEPEIDRQASAFLREHGSDAVHVALEKLNESIDRHDWNGRDFWVQVVRAIHEYRAHQKNG